MFAPKLILAPVDFSEPSQEALKTAEEMAKAFGSELLLVHAVPAIPRLPSPAEFFHEGKFEDALHKEAEERLTKLAQRLSESGLRARTEVGIANDVGMEILRIAQHNHADMIVIATHGMTGWHELALGSVAEKVVKMATCPVLVLRAARKGAHEEASRAGASVAV